MILEKTVADQADQARTVAPNEMLVRAGEQTW